MGTWSIKSLYGNDYALDLKSEMRAVLSSMDVKEGTEILLNYYNGKVDSDEEPIFWSVLADILFTNGHLTSDIKMKVLESLDSKAANYSFEPVLINKLKAKFNSEQIEPRKIGKPRLFRTKFKEGDILLYKFNSLWYEYHDDSKLESIKNKYTLLNILKVYINPLSRILLEDGPCDKYAYAGMYNIILNESDISDVDFNTLKFLPLYYHVSYKNNHSTTIFGGISDYIIKSRNLSITNLGVLDAPKVEINMEKLFWVSNIMPEYKISELMKKDIIIGHTDSRFLLNEEKLKLTKDEYSLNLMGINLD
jgi:hypothetical protein